MPNGIAFRNTSIADRSIITYFVHDTYIFRVDSMFAPSQWETALLCNDDSHWLGVSLESALILYIERCGLVQDCSITSTLIMVLLQSYTKPSRYGASIFLYFVTYKLLLSGIWKNLRPDLIIDSKSHKSSHSLNIAKCVVKKLKLLLYMAGTSIAILPRQPSNFRAIGKLCIDLAPMRLREIDQ